MKRLALLGAGTMVLAAAILMIRPPENIPRATAKNRADHLNGDRPSSAEGEFRSGTRHPEPGDRFQVQAWQIAAMPQDSGRENALRELAQAWAKAAPVAAERWARALDDPAERERALTHVCLEVAVQDPREAIRIAQANELHHGIVEAVASRWAAADFTAAAAWADEAPHGEIRDRVLARLIQSRAAEVPAEAATMLSRSALSGTAHEEAAIAVVHQWLLKNPEAARQWVNLFPDGPVRTRAMAEIQGMTARRDRETGKDAR